VRFVACAGFCEAFATEVLFTEVLLTKVLPAFRDTAEPP
jgi:hypothetical protein